MKIIIDLQSCQNGSKLRGIGRYSLNVAKELIRSTNQHSFIILLTDRFANSIDYVRSELDGVIDQDSIVVCSLFDGISSADPENYWRNHAAESLYASFVTRLGADIVFIPSPFEGFWDSTVVSIDRSTYRSVVTLHDLIPLEEPNKYIPAQRDRDAYLKRLNDVKQADLVVAISTFVADEARRRMAVEGNRLITALNGIDGSFFHPPKGDKVAREDLMARLGISRPFVFNSSPLEHRKNLEGLIASFGSMKPSVRNAHQLVIAGKFDAYAQNYLRGLARAEGLADDSLVLPGFVSDSDLVALYGQCAVFVFPSWSEGFGLPIIEAMACGAPTLAVDTTSLPEVIGRQDLLMDPKSTSSMAAAIEKVLETPDLQRELKNYGIDRAKQFTWSRTAKTILEGMERKFSERVIDREGGRQTTSRPRIAIVCLDIDASNHIAGRINGVIIQLASYCEVILVGPSGFHADQNTSALVELRDLGWLDWNASQFDQIFYVGNNNSDRNLLNFMSAHRGIYVEIKPLLPLRLYINNGKLPDAPLIDLYKTRGVVGLIEASLEQHNADYLFSAFGQAYGQFSLGIISEGNDGLPTLPLSADAKVANQYRHKMGVSEDKILFVAIVDSRDTAARFIGAYRSAFNNRNDAQIIIHVISERERDDSDKNPFHISNGIRYIIDGLEEYYRGIFSAANYLMIGSDLPENLMRLLKDDANALNLSFCEESNSLTEIESEICSQKEIFYNSPSTQTALVVPPSQRAVNMWAATFMKYATSPRVYNECILRLVDSKLRRSVRGKTATSLDLARLAVALEKNSSYERSPLIAIDITAFAAPNAVRRFEPREIHQLFSLIRRVGKDAIAVYDGGGYFVAANQFVAKLLKINASFADDYLVNIRAGDRIVGFDDFNSFAEGSSRALIDAQERGARLCFVSSAGTSRLETAGMVAEVLVKWMETRKHTWRTSLSGSDVHNRKELVSSAVKRILALSTDQGLKFDVLELGSPSTDLYPMPFHIQWEELPSSAALEAERLVAHVAEATRDGADLHYSVVGHLLGSYSLAIINRSVAATLEDNFPGHSHFRPYETDPIHHTEGVPKEQQPLMIELCARPLPPPEQEVVISQHWPILPPSWAPRLAFSLFPWEETHVPKGIIDTLTEGFDAIISPTKFVSDALSISGCRLPVATIGQPVELQSFWDIASTRTSKVGLQKFLHISSCFPRKGVDVLLKAWVRAFTLDDGVELIIKTFPNPHNDVEEQLQALRRTHVRMAPVRVINQDVEPEKLRDFYKEADVMVLPSRGEGYNLPALEAMAAGLPVIVTGQGGQRDFCGPSQARLLKYCYARSSSHVQGSHSMWLEPDIDDLVLALREMADPERFDEIEQRRVNALAVSRIEGDKHAWARRFQDVTRALLVHNDYSAARIGWVSTWGIQCGIAQYSGYLLDRMSNDQRKAVTILCDHRYPKQTNGTLEGELRYDPIWNFTGDKAQVIVDEVLKRDLEALVIQHQDGLISWEQLGQLGHDERIENIVSVAVLHNARNLRRAASDEIEKVVSGLAKLSRVVVHNIDDMNFLLGLGLNKNLGLFPHGAFSPRNTPWPRTIGPSDSPVIGCHGFFFRHKGIDKLIKAAAIMKRQWPGLRLRLVNARFPGKEHDQTILEAQSLAKDLGLENSIDWHLDFLPVDEIEELLGGCDIIALPYDESDDSASGAVRTSLATMVPLVATRVQIFAELEGAVAWAENNDPAELANVISELIKSTAKRRDIQAGMYEWLRAHDWDLLANRLENMLNGLVQRKRLGWNRARNSIM